MTHKAAEMVLKAEEEMAKIKPSSSGSVIEEITSISSVYVMLAQVDLLAEIALHLEEMKLSIERSRGL